MRELFGIPAENLLVGLGAVTALALGAVALVATRNRVLLRLGLRNATRRRGRTALIVLGLMLGTAIVSAALATGDTMSHTIRSSAVTALGETDELVSPRSAEMEVQDDFGSATAAVRTRRGPMRTRPDGTGRFRLVGCRASNGASSTSFTA